jgi:hypothetical protein
VPSLHLQSEQDPYAKREVESNNEGQGELVRCNDGVVLRDATGEGGGVAVVGGEGGSDSESESGSWSADESEGGRVPQLPVSHAKMLVGQSEGGKTTPFIGALQ